MTKNENESYKVMKITNKRGLHARASAKFVQCVEKFDAEIRVSKDGHIVGGSSIMGLMMLTASLGSDIYISANGPQAEEALQAISKLINEKFGEDD